MKKLAIALVAVLALPAMADEMSERIQKLREEQKRVEIERARSEAKFQARIMDLELEIRELELKQLASRAKDVVENGPEISEDAKQQIEKLQVAFEEYVKWAQERLKEGVQKAVDKVREGNQPESQPSVHEEKPPKHPKVEKNDGAATYKLGVAKYDDGAFEEAAKLFHKAAEQKFEPAASCYNEACSWALAGNQDKAIAALGQAIEAGYDDVDHMEEDADLESLHDNAAFKKLVKELKK